VFTKNRERLLRSEVADGFFEQVLKQARAQQLLSSDHFTVDGTLIEAWAGQKSFQRKDGKTKPPEDGGSNATIDFHGEKRGNDTHRSTTDPEARLFKKSRGSESKLSFMAHVLMENRNGLVVDTRLTKSTGKAARESAWMMAWRVAKGERRITVGGDKNYDTQQIVASLRAIQATPHVAQNEHAHRSSAIDARTTRHDGYAVSQRKRKHRGRKRVGWMFTLAAAAFNLVRLRNPTALAAACAPVRSASGKNAASASAEPTRNTYKARLSSPSSTDFQQPARKLSRVDPLWFTLLIMAAPFRDSSCWRGLIANPALGSSASS
jgi:hypothetical protein